MQPFGGQGIDPSKEGMPAMDRHKERSSDAPRRVWFVYNPGSHSAAPEVIDAVRDAVARHGAEMAGETRFPDEEMPDEDALARVDADTLVTLGGDGTITCAATRLAAWDGRLLVLPGGTMNLIPKDLHASMDVGEIIGAVFSAPRLVALPYAQVEEHRSYARMIAGPAASFVHVREEIRSGGWRRMWRALRFAWRTLWMRSVRVEGEDGRYRAIFIRPGADKQLHLEPLEVSGPISAFRLAWTWVADLIGDETVVENPGQARVTLLSSRPIRMLLDGEEMFFDPPVRLEPACSAPMFFTTNPVEEAA